MPLVFGVTLEMYKAQLESMISIDPALDRYIRAAIRRIEMLINGGKR